MSYGHHLASVVIRRNLFKKSSPLKVLDQWKPMEAAVTKNRTYGKIAGFG
jgi:hypothetical protein